jgi:hypothetical protein
MRRSAFGSLKPARSRTGLLLPGLLVLALCSFGSGCRRDEPPDNSGEAGGPVWFEDVTEKVGLKFVHDAGPVGSYFMPQQVGSGAALFDFDGDGRLDIYLLHNGGPRGKKNQLFRQMPDGTFKDVSAGSGLGFSGYCMGVAVGDVNNDGKPDVFVTEYCGVKLFLNNGDGTFTDVTKEAGLSNPGWGTSAAFFDYDRDGWLDLVVVNYVDYDPTWPCRGTHGEPDYCAPKTFKGRVSRLFRNLGPARAGQGGAPPRVRFADVTERSGLGRLPGPGLGVVCADFDGDGWPDIFIANDGKPNHLWINQKDGTFKEEAVQRGVSVNAMGQAQAGMGIALGDVNGDGLLDLFVTHLTEETHTLWLQGPRGLFQDRTAEAGLIRTRWRGTGFGALLTDFDHDGALDLAVVNGRVSARAKVTDWSLGPFWSKYGDRNQLFRNKGKGQFEDISPQNPAFCGPSNMGRGLVRGDFDGDGAVDLLVTTIGGLARLFRNVAPKCGRWLQVRAFDPALRRDALGAEVRVRAGTRTWVCLMHPAESYLCSSQPLAHFGLGDVERVDAIEVVWPDGARQTHPGCKTNRRIEVRKKSTPSGKVSP